ncbi:MAG: LytTR family DNA-binding domain-containing protein [Bacteroidota bacterium]|nr:LytTR family DNA-binding domain-containing protein [Bacteroidota bacterium]
MDPISCVLIDDEPFARKGLQGYVEKIDFLALKGVCENALELNSLLKEGPVDLLFLDIEMPYISGIEFLRSAAPSCRVIFTTAYEKYALEGFELEVLDYLMKPVSFDRFVRAVNKAYDYFRLLRATDGGAHGPGVSGSGIADAGDYIFVKAEHKLEKISFADILFIEALENYVAIRTKEKRIMAHLTLKMVQERLPAGSFIQTHKSWLAAVDKIDSIEGNILHIGAFRVPVSKNLREEVMERLVNSKLLKR